MLIFIRNTNILNLEFYSSFLYFSKPNLWVLVNRVFFQLHVTDNEECAVIFYPSLLSISLNVKTTVTVQCLCLMKKLQ